MECQNTIKTLKFNKDKKIGTVVIIVEGEQDEFTLLKHIFTQVLDYSYRYIKKNKILHDEYKLEDKKNTVIIANTRNSNIDSVINDEDYKVELSKLLKRDYNKNLKNTSIYIIWDRDKDKNDGDIIQEHYKDAIENFYSAYDNDYEMNGLLLLSYPCHESFILSNFKKRFWLNRYSTSQECKKAYNTSINSIKDINENTILLAAENMHKAMKECNIDFYDPSNFRNTNEKIYKKEEEYFDDNKYFLTLSLISVMLIDLGIIVEE